MEFLSSGLAEISFDSFMREALLEAQAAGLAGELPIGAVLVIQGKIISRGRARHQEFKSQLRHAELNALLKGGEALWQHFSQAILFTSVEPCSLCLGAAVMADVPHIIFGMRDPGIHSATSVAQNPYIRRHLRSYYGGVLDDESASLFEKYAPQALAYIRAGGNR